MSQPPIDNRELLDSSTVTEYRAHFDADVEFANGGRLTAERFRLDLPGPDLSEDQIAQLFVQHLGLALVAAVELRSLDIVAEPHKGSRGVAAQPTTERRGQLVDLSHIISAGLITYPGIPVPTITPHLTREQSRVPLRGGHRVRYRRDHAWPATPAPIWIVPTTVTRLGPISLTSTWRRWSICPSSCFG